MFVKVIILIFVSAAYFSMVVAQMKDFFNCYDHFSSRNTTEAMATHSNLCYMLAKCTEHVIRYQTNYSTALSQNVSCCKSFDETYYQQNDSHCKIDCNIKCHKTTCSYRIKPGQGCRCDSGYIYNNVDDKCVAKCPRSCQTKKCSEPNKCICLPGYENIQNRCVPNCLDSCTSTNGFCLRPNICQCSPGFNLNPSGKSCFKTVEASKVIQLISRSTEKSIECDKSCSNGYCITDVCVCNEGYTLNENKTFCEPFCSKNCENGICVMPNTCLCNKNFKPTSDTFICEPLDFSEDASSGVVLKSSFTNDTKHVFVFLSVCALIVCVVLRSVESQIFERCRKNAKDQKRSREHNGGRIIQWYGNIGYLTPGDSDKEFFV